MTRGAAALALLVAIQASPSPGAAREIAITFDDLPVASSIERSAAQWDAITADLLSAIARHRVPAIGFVNEHKLEIGGVVDERRTALLRRWLDAGLELGNHTYSHPDLHTTPLDVVEQDVLRGERVTKRLAGEAGRPFRFFRHPFLHTGRSLDVRLAFEQFLSSHGYRVAPVTIDNYDYVFAAAFDRAADSSARSKIAEEYERYLTAVVAYYEQQSIAIVGREIPQVLLLHANALNAARFDALAHMLLGRGYTFVTLDHSLQDAAYHSADTFVGTGGITWLHRWALTQGKRGAIFAGEPTVPQWIEQAARPR